MAAPSVKYIQRVFPALEGELLDYVESILNETFESADEIYDAIGSILHEVDEGKSENEVIDLCTEIYNFSIGSKTVEDEKPHKILDAPIHLGQLAENMDASDNDNTSIWLNSKDKESQVDKKKLEKAEAKIKEKVAKRVQQDLIPRNYSNGSLEDATASQMSNRKFDKMEASGNNRSYDIQIENFDVSFGEKVLLQSANLNLAQGRRYGLIGRNGKGKTTLLRMLAGRSLRIPSHISVLHVEQEVVGNEVLAVDSVLECDTVRNELLNEEKAIVAQLQSSSPSNSELNTRLNEVYHQLSAIEADKAPAKAAVILSGLGFTTEMQGQATKTFSGGWRMRLALARALFSKPDLLLLDEPTNMLDMKAIIWLETYLQDWQTTILVVSHDRSFLNAVCTDIIHLHSRILDAYKGDYEVFVKTKEEKLKNQQREYDAQKQYRDHIQIFIDRFRYNANRASQVQSKLKLLEKLPPLKPVEKQAEAVLKFPDTEFLPPPVLQLNEVDFYYVKDRYLFKNVNLSASSDSRICIVGENGAGKTTLLKILMGDLDPVGGFRHGHRNLKLSYFSQHHVDQLEMNVTCVELLAQKYPGFNSEKYRHQLGSFGVTGDLALQSVLSLSGGQKSRVAFAQMCMANPNFFILDEPTNHLDMESIEALGRAINKFNGGVVLVSHDERLIRMVCKELWVCGGGTVEALEGGFDEYRKIVKRELGL